jgi:phage host-nuclease inhibitor protein Gam
MMTLNEIEALTTQFAEAHQERVFLEAEIGDLVKSIEVKYGPRLRATRSKVEHRLKKLYDAVDQAPDLFKSPRTRTWAQVKVGYEKGKGGIVFGDPDQVVVLIKRHFADQAKRLIHTRECPNKEGLESLTVADLKRVGCEVAAAGDRVVIRPPKWDTDKLVAGLIKKLGEDGE